MTWHCLLTLALCFPTSCLLATANSLPGYWVGGSVSSGLSVPQQSFRTSMLSGRQEARNAPRPPRTSRPGRTPFCSMVAIGSIFAARVDRALKKGARDELKTIHDRLKNIAAPASIGEASTYYGEGDSIGSLMEALKSDAKLSANFQEYILSLSQNQDIFDAINKDLSEDIWTQMDINKFPTPEQLSQALPEFTKVLENAPETIKFSTDYIEGRYLTAAKTVILNEFGAYAFGKKLGWLVEWQDHWQAFKGIMERVDPQGVDQAQKFAQCTLSQLESGALTHQIQESILFMNQLAGQCVQ